MTVNKGFIEMWEEADAADALSGGMDSVPEWEQYDYKEALLNEVRASIREHKQELKGLSNGSISRDTKLTVCWHSEKDRYKVKEGIC